MSRFTFFRTGFSLIELAVVVTIIGILAAIAIPTFLGQRDGASDRMAQTNLRNVLTVLKTATAAANYFEYYPGGDSAGLAEIIFENEPSVVSRANYSTDPNTISVYRVDEDTVILAARSNSGVCWYVRAELLVPNFFASPDSMADTVDRSVCDAAVLTDVERVSIARTSFAN